MTGSSLRKQHRAPAAAAATTAAVGEGVSHHHHHHYDPSASGPTTTTTTTTLSEEEHLRVELQELRESTRKAILESWAETEQLQGENSDFMERNYTLEVELDASKKREDKLRKELLLLKRKVLTMGTDEPSSSSSPNNHHERGESVGNGPLGRFLATVNSNRALMNNNNNNDHNRVSPMDTDLSKSPNSSGENSSDPSFKHDNLNNNSNNNSNNSIHTFWGRRQGVVMAEGELLVQQQMKELEDEKKRLVAEWQVKVECRDTALQHMESRTLMQKEDIELLQAQLDDALEANEELRHIHSKEIHAYKKKLHDKKKLIVKQAEQMKAMQAYIEELTAELEKFYPMDESTVGTNMDESTVGTNSLVS